MSNRIGAFEIKVAVIAILIPVFLQILPEAIKGVSYPPFTFILPQILSYLIGVVWSFVLILGLFNLKSDIEEKESGRKYNFELVFDTAVNLTAGLLGLLFLAYPIIFANFYAGIIPTLLTTMALYALTWYMWRFRK